MTVVTLRPDGTTTNGGTIVGGGTAHDALSDDSDTTYITFDNGETWVGTIDDLTLPVGAVIKRTSASVRVRSDASGNFAIASASLTHGSGTFSGSVATPWVDPVRVNVFRADQFVSDADIDGAALTVACLTGASVDIYEAFVEITYVEQPSLTVSAPTGTVDDTNQPTVTWTLDLDDAGGAQAIWEVKVYTDAQYGALGFNPSITTPTASTTNPGSSTGESAFWRFTTDTSWQVDEILPDDTYRAYVRVAQIVNGNQHWSDWAHADFTVDVDLPAVPTLTATADSSNGRVTLAVTEGASGAATTDVLEVQRSVDGGTTWEVVRTLDDDGQLVLPYVVATGATAETADSTSHTFNLPDPDGGILAGDLLVAIAGLDDKVTFTWPTGWLEIKDETGNGDAVSAGVAYKWADGGEAGTISVSTSVGPTGGGARILCIRGADPDTPPEISTGVSASTANANPDSLNPTGWDVENTLWIAAMVNDGDVAVTAGPTGYVDFGNTRWASTSGAGVATAVKRSAAASEDPGAFTHTAEDTRAFTIAVRPLHATAATVYDYEAPNGTQVNYRARALHNYSGAFAASDWDTDTATWTSTSWWLKHPNQPDLNIEVVPRSLSAVARAGRIGIFQPLGSATAVVVADTRGPKTGQVVLRSLSETEQDNLDALLDETATLLLQSPTGEGGPGYIRVGGHERARIVDYKDATKVWETLEYVAVASPPGVVVEWPS